MIPAFTWRAFDPVQVWQFWHTAYAVYLYLFNTFYFWTCVSSFLCRKNWHLSRHECTRIFCWLKERPLAAFQTLMQWQIQWQRGPSHTHQIASEHPWSSVWWLVVQWQEDLQSGFWPLWAHMYKLSNICTSECFTPMVEIVFQWPCPVCRIWTNSPGSTSKVIIRPQQTSWRPDTFGFAFFRSFCTALNDVVI